ncbi:TPA: SDR family NAD(P)-dependent oxidoreductase [Candidatus Saccharibacteria bacterium]|nr:SDR family NAD(P)-dependent oxidoreductase [Candidatus Saccharibacteria bacterium]HRK40489.1 SDR family oxidoreductase [Candidatus Saccharibacteria bacterium]
MTQHKMQDPVSQYPVMDIPKQRQDEPGLDSKLLPKADHGEETYEGSGRLEGRKALITGADSGIGRAVAIAYAREGADVAITYLPSEQEDADEVMKVLDATGRKAVAIPGDLSDEAFCKQLIKQASDELGGLDILVNNAGKQLYVDDILELETAQLEATFRVNIFAMFWLIKAALPTMPKGASIINTTSIQAYQPSEGLLDYAATKAAIANFTHGLAKQLAPKGIRVNGVAPGPIWTPLQPSYGQPMEKLVQFGQATPLGRAGQPAELAPAYVFLASQESSYTTGEIIGVTGGQHLP